jgi:hypothetical protein
MRPILHSQSFTGSNKPFIYFYFFDAKANKLESISKYVGKNSGNYTATDEAKDLFSDLTNNTLH